MIVEILHLTLHCLHSVLSGIQQLPVLTIPTIKIKVTGWDMISLIVKMLIWQKSDGIRKQMLHVMSSGCWSCWLRADRSLMASRAILCCMWWLEKSWTCSLWHPTAACAHDTYKKINIQGVMCQKSFRTECAVWAISGGGISGLRHHVTEYPGSI